MGRKGRKGIKDTYLALASTDFSNVPICVHICSEFKMSSKRCDYILCM